jgi:uncharacterized membrane protein (DUF373 family)
MYLNENSIIQLVFGFFLPLLLISAINIAFGVIAVSMANKRGLRPVPAFFAGLFGSFLALFIIAMLPKNRHGGF